MLNLYDTVVRLPTGELVIQTTMAANSDNLILPVHPETGEVLQGDNLRSYITTNNWDKLVPKNPEIHTPIVVNDGIAYSIENGDVPVWFSNTVDQLANTYDSADAPTNSNNWTFISDSTFNVSLLNPQANDYIFFSNNADLANSIPHPTHSTLVRSNFINVCTVGAWKIQNVNNLAGEDGHIVNPKGTLHPNFPENVNSAIPWRSKRRHKFTAIGGEKNDWVCIVDKNNEFWNNEIVFADSGEVVSNVASSTMQYMFILTGSVTDASGTNYGPYEFVSAKANKAISVTANENTSLIKLWK